MRPGCAGSTTPNATRSSDAFDRYLETIPKTKRFRGIAYDVKDVIGKTGFGIGSAGLPRYTVLIEGFNQALDNDIVLSMKQGNVAAPSRVINDPDVHEYFKHHGHRTAVSQRALQAHADPLLGYTDIDGVGFVVSELSPYDADLDWSELTEPDELTEVIEQLGQAVAKVHCVSDTDSDQSLVDFQTEEAIVAVIGDDDRRIRRRHGRLSGWSTPRSCATTTGISSRRSAKAASRHHVNLNGLSRRADPVVVDVDDGRRAVTEIEFDEDAADVALDGDARDDELVSDLSVRATLGDQCQHVEFARCQVDDGAVVQRIGRLAVCCQYARSHRRIEIAVSPCHRSNSAYQFLGRSNP